jgi:uncharacterized membrane protein HdeD (DUF308 family)
MLGWFTRDWWMFAVRGVAAIVFGILALIWPETTLQVLVLLFGAYVLVDGITLLVALARGDVLARRHFWPVAIMGVLGIGAGLATFVWPDLTALTLLYVVALWAVATGILQVMTGITLRREIDGELWMVLGGLLSIVFGAYLIVFPGAGLISLVWLVGLWALAFGFSSLGLAWRLRTIDKELSSARIGSAHA